MSSKKYTDGNIIPGCICSVVNSEGFTDHEEVEVIARMPCFDYSDFYLCKFINKPDFPSEACVIFHADDLHNPYYWC